MFQRLLPSTGTVTNQTQGENTLDLTKLESLILRKCFRPFRFSPIIRKCMAEMRNDLEENLLKIVQRNIQHFSSATPAPQDTPKNQTALPTTIRQEIKTIMKEVLFENNKICHNLEETNQHAQTILSIKPKRQLVSSSVLLG